MAGYLAKAKKKIYVKRGVSALLCRSMRFGYDNSLRCLLPKQIAVYNGVPVRAARLGDSYIPWHETHRPTYEETLLESSQELIQAGDTVVIIGGGWGVSTVEIARQIGEGGEVITYEGSKKAVKDIVDTVQLSGLGDRITVRHAVVGENISIRHHEDLHADTILSPKELPECDAVVLDCEGAERQILEQMDLPDRIVVETHGLFGAATDEIVAILSEHTYDVENQGVANTNKIEFCRENDIRVLSAIK